MSSFPLFQKFPKTIPWSYYSENFQKKNDHGFILARSYLREIPDNCPIQPGNSAREFSQEIQPGNDSCR